MIDDARFINIESVLKSLDKRVTQLERESVQQPEPAEEIDDSQISVGGLAVDLGLYKQPRTPRLVEACEVMLAGWARSEGCWSITMENVRRALAAEKKRQELVDLFINSIRDLDKGTISHNSYEALLNLDAFDKDGGK